MIILLVRVEVELVIYLAVLCSYCEDATSPIVLIVPVTSCDLDRYCLSVELLEERVVLTCAAAVERDVCVACCGVEVVVRGIIC